MSERSDKRDRRVSRADPEAVAEALAQARSKSLDRMGFVGGVLSRRLVLVSRCSALIIVALYLFLASRRGVHLVRVVQFVVLPVVAVSFPVSISRAVGRLTLFQAAQRESPPLLTLIVGWVLLLAPLWLGLAIEGLL